MELLAHILGVLRRHESTHERVCGSSLPRSQFSRANTPVLVRQLRELTVLVDHARWLLGRGAALLPGKMLGRAYCSDERTHCQGSQDSSLGTLLSIFVKNPVLQPSVSVPSTSYLPLHLYNMGGKRLASDPSHHK